MRLDPDYAKTSTPGHVLGGLTAGLKSYFLNFGWGGGAETLSNILDLFISGGDEKELDIALTKTSGTLIRPLVPAVGLATFLNNLGNAYLGYNKSDKSGINAATNVLSDIPVLNYAAKGAVSAFSVIPFMSNIDAIYPYVDVDPIGYQTVDRFSWGILPFDFDKSKSEENAVPRIWKALRKYPEAFGFKHFYVNDRTSNYEDILTSPTLSFKGEVKQRAADLKREELEKRVEAYEDLTKGEYDPELVAPLLKYNIKLNNAVNDHVLVEKLIIENPSLAKDEKELIKDSEFDLYSRGKAYSWDNLVKYLNNKKLVLIGDKVRDRSAIRSSSTPKEEKKQTGKIKKILDKGR
jgi:hypothetical protein